MQKKRLAQSRFFLFVQQIVLRDSLLHAASQGNLISLSGKEN